MPKDSTGLQEFSVCDGNASRYIERTFVSPERNAMPSEISPSSTLQADILPTPHRLRAARGDRPWAALPALGPDDAIPVNANGTDTAPAHDEPASAREPGRRADWTELDIQSPGM